MAQAQNTATLNTTDQFPSNRLVWVLNTHTDPYKAEFQGTRIVVPAMCEKIPKHVRDGGNLMEYLAARKFIGDFKQPQGKTETGEPIFGPKALQSIELTEKERAEITGTSKTDVAKEAAAEERKARRSLTENLKKVSNKVSLAEQLEP